MSSENGIPWEDVEHAASRMFSVWTSGGELEWARECWSHFAKDGLTSGASVIDISTSHLRLLALAKVYEEFAGYMWDENPGSELTSLAERLEIDPVALGIIVAADAELGAKEIDEPADLREHALRLATDKLRPDIHGCLADAYGGLGALYSRLARTNQTFDDEDDALQDSMEEFAITGSHMRAWAFVSNCFQEP